MNSVRKSMRQIPLAVTLLVFLRQLLAFIPNSLRFMKTLIRFRLTSREKRFVWKWSELYPCLSDNSRTTRFDRHYIFHTAWASRILAQTRPSLHHDVSSALYFSTIVSAFIPIRFYDYRPAPVSLSGMTCGQADLMKLPFESDSIDSLSCMHVVEHVGLGRYGDPLDPDGDRRAMTELARVVKPGGQLLFVVPVGGTARILFNAHRIYTPDMIRAYFSDQFELKEWQLIPEHAIDGDLISNPEPSLIDRQYYACGCFWFVKKR